VNAFALRIEAEILVKQGSLSRAYSLACVGIEELAKMKVCLGLRDGDRRFRHYANHEKFWAFWRDHQLKVAMGLLGIDIELESRPEARSERTRLSHQIDNGKERLKEYEQALRETEETAEILTLAREDGLYFDIVSIGNNQVAFKDPHTIPRELAEDLVGQLGKLVDELQEGMDPIIKSMNASETSDSRAEEK